jgi:hypothetical protein
MNDMKNDLETKLHYNLLLFLINKHLLLIGAEFELVANSNLNYYIDDLRAGYLKLKKKF